MSAENQRRLGWREVARRQLFMAKGSQKREINRTYIPDRCNSHMERKKYIQEQMIILKIVNCLTEDWVRDVHCNNNDEKKGF